MLLISQHYIIAVLVHCKQFLELRRYFYTTMPSDVKIWFVVVGEMKSRM